MKLVGPEQLVEGADAATSGAGEVEQEEDEQVDAAIAAFPTDFDEVSEASEDPAGNEFEQQEGARSGGVGDSRNIWGSEGDFCALR